MDVDLHDRLKPVPDEGLPGRGWSALVIGTALAVLGAAFAVALPYAMGPLPNDGERTGAHPSPRPAPVVEPSQSAAGSDGDVSEVAPQIRRDGPSARPRKHRAKRKNPVLAGDAGGVRAGGDRPGGPEGSGGGSAGSGGDGDGSTAPDSGVGGSTGGSSGGGGAGGATTGGDTDSGGDSGGSDGGTGGDSGGTDGGTNGGGGTGGDGAGGGDAENDHQDNKGRDNVDDASGGKGGGKPSDG